MSGFFGGSGGGSSFVTSILNNQYSSTPVTGTGAAVVLFTYTLPGNTLGAGGGIRVITTGSHSTGSASVTYTFKFGGTTVSTIAATTTGANGYRYECIILNKPAVTNAQSAINQGIYAATPASGQQQLTAAIDTTADTTVVFDFNVAATDAVTPLAFLVERL
jgi:hypothetical protein